MRLLFRILSCVLGTAQASAQNVASQELLVLTADEGPVGGVVGIEGGVVSGVINLESSGVGASDWRPRHEKHYQQV